MAKIYSSLVAWRQLRQQAELANHGIGFVPTMGNLHQGHQSLLQRSMRENDYTVLSIFVNPTQFNNAEDLANYPRTQAQDIELATASGVDFILMPEFTELYPDGFRYRVSEAEYSQQLEGKYRPGHFTGMLTVILKLIQLVKPNRIYFGEKDFQQWQLVQQMAASFFLDTEVVACPTVRNEDGLALSSRNNRLSSEDLKHASWFPKLLNSSASCAEITRQLAELGFQVDYIEDYRGRRFGAVYLGGVRLIDNFPIESN